MKVAGKVEIDILHGYNLSISAAGSAALYAEYRPQGWLAQSDHYVFAQFLKTVSQTYRGGSFAFSGRSRVDSGNQYQFSIGSIGFLQ